MRHIYINKERFSIVVAILVISLMVYYYNTKDINLKIAYDGWGPQDYVNQKLKPKNYKKNWQNGIMVYDNSIPMRIYYYLEKYYDINPSKTTHPFMFIQTLLFLSSVAFLVQILFQNKFVTILSVLIVPLSNLSGLNLSRFGNGFGSYLSFPLYYGYSNAFRIFALGFFLKNTYILMCVFLALSIYCHLSMGFFAVAFIGGYLLYKPTFFREKYFQIGMLLFLVLVVPHIYLVICNTAVSSAEIPVAQWVKSTKIFSFHWYPITTKMFTKNALNRFFPFLLVCFFFFVALRYHDIKDEKNLKVILGTVTCLILSVFGVIFSDVFPVPVLIKISLQRSTELITFFGVIYTIYYLFRKMDTRNNFVIFLACYTLLLLIFSKPGIAVLPLFLLIYFDIRDGYIGPIKIESKKITMAKSLYTVLFICILLITTVCILQNNHKIINSLFVFLWTPLQHFNPFHMFDFLLKGGAFKIAPDFTYVVVGSFLITLVINFFKETDRKKTLRICFTILLFLISLSTVWYLKRDQYLRWHTRYSEIASSYLDVQLWAREKTQTDALFMPDPTHYYGWRDFSERSSFGSLREWGYTSIAYVHDKQIFEEGLKRLSEYGIDISKINSDQIKKYVPYPYSSQFDENVRHLFNNMDLVQMQKWSADYGIDFFIINKDIRQTPIKNLFKMFKIVYSNDHFFVFNKGKQEAIFESTFSKWNGQDKISMNDLSRIAAPLTIQGVRGDFSFNRIHEFNGYILRVFPNVQEKIDGSVIQFGYNSNEYGFDLNLQPGQHVIFLVDARLSDKTKKPASIFIQDKVENWDRKSIIINETHWQEYVVSKKIRNGAKRVNFGITWKPTKKSDWVDIKQFKIFPVK